MVAVFQYMSDKKLYRLMTMNGTVGVLREGEMINMNHTEVVPGDIVRLVVSFSMLVDVIVCIYPTAKLPWTLTFA